MNNNLALANPPGTLFFAQSLGHKFALHVSVRGVFGGVERFTLSAYKNGVLTGVASGPRRWVELRTAQVIHDESFADGIRYFIMIDEIGVKKELAEANQDAWFPAQKVNQAALPVAA